MLCLYVDDILIFGSEIHMIDDIKEFLKNNFDMKGLNLVEFILGVKIIRDGDSIVIILRSC